MSRKKNPLTAESLNPMPSIVETRPPAQTPSLAQLGRMTARYIAMTSSWLHYNSIGAVAHADRMQRASMLAGAAAVAIDGGQYSDARQLVGLVQGILYAVGIYNWEHIASDDER